MNLSVITSHIWASLLVCHEQFMTACSLIRESDEPNPEAVAKLEEFVVQLPRATAPPRLQLNVASGDQFKKLVEKYIVKYLAKGVPSLFADIKSLYADKDKQQTIEGIVEALREEYASSSALPPTSSDAYSEPTTYLWTLYYLAQHYSYLSQPDKALSLLDMSLKHTPTLPELHMCKARTLKRAGDYLGAARCQNDARLLDGQDRFLNTKFGKYLLRAGMVDEANSIFGMFTKVCSIVSPCGDDNSIVFPFRKTPQALLLIWKTCNLFFSSSTKRMRIDETESSISPSRSTWLSKKSSTTSKTISLISMGITCENSQLTSTSSTFTSNLSSE